MKRKVPGLLTDYRDLGKKVTKKVKEDRTELTVNTKDQGRTPFRHL